MQQARLQDVKTYYICPAHNPKYMSRKLHMDKLLTQLGFTDFHHYKSGTDAYPACLSRATVEILRANPDEPVLILEDDIETTGQLTFDLPAGTDAIYFGLSRHAGSRIRNQHEGPAVFAPYSETQVRVLNMLSGHAILYVSAAYKERVAHLLEEHMTTPYYNDVLMSRLQSQFMVLANRKPAFWQSNVFNHPHNLERVTKFEIIYPSEQLKGL